MHVAKIGRGSVAGHFHRLARFVYGPVFGDHLDLVIHPAGSGNSLADRACFTRRVFVYVHQKFAGISVADMYMYFGNIGFIRDRCIDRDQLPGSKYLSLGWTADTDHREHLVLFRFGFAAGGEEG